VIILSIRKDLLGRVAFPGEAPWKLVHTVERARPYIVEGRRVELPDGTTTLLIRGRAANTPFGTVANTDRLAIGRSIARHLAQN
jgi:hypothetical protein